MPNTTKSSSFSFNRHSSRTAANSLEDVPEDVAVDRLTRQTSQESPLSGKKSVTFNPTTRVKRISGEFKNWRSKSDLDHGNVDHRETKHNAYDYRHTLPPLPSARSLSALSPEVNVPDTHNLSSRKNSDFQSLENRVISLFGSINAASRTTSTSALGGETIGDQINAPATMTGSRLESGELAQLHEMVRSLIDSKAGPFVYEYFKTRMLPKGMASLRDDLIKSNGHEDLLFKLAKIWDTFFTETLTNIDCVLYLVKTKCSLSIRQTTLLAFRDELLFKTDFHEAVEFCLTNDGDNVPREIKHMVLILEGVSETYPPSRNKLRLETILASLVTPFLGYRGLYVDFVVDEPLVSSNEPTLAAKRKSVEPEPFAVTPVKRSSRRSIRRSFDLIRSVLKNNFNKSRSKSFDVSDRERSTFYVSTPVAHPPVEL